MPKLAERRPAAFLVFGLYGVAVLLLAGVALVLVASGGIASQRASRVAGVILAIMGIVLVIRGVGLEVLLATDTGGFATELLDLFDEAGLRIERHEDVDVEQASLHWRDTRRDAVSAAHHGNGSLRDPVHPTRGAGRGMMW